MKPLEFLQLTVATREKINVKGITKFIVAMKDLRGLNWFGVVQNLVLNVLFRAMSMHNSIRGIFCMEQKMVLLNFAPVAILKPGKKARGSRTVASSVCKWAKQSCSDSNCKVHHSFSWYEITGSRPTVLIWSFDNWTDTDVQAQTVEPLARGTHVVFTIFYFENRWPNFRRNLQYSITTFVLLQAQEF